MKYLPTPAVSFLMFILAAAFTPVAHAAESDSGEAVLRDVEALVVQCAVQPYALDRNGGKVLGLLRSSCSELNVTDHGVELRLNGATYVAVVEESEQADDGDLDNVTLLNERHEAIAARTNVPAFGDALLALAGGEKEFRLEYDPSLARK